jgi:hypothetical protein
MSSFLEHLLGFGFFAHVIYPPSFPSFIKHNMYMLMLFFGNYWWHSHVYLVINLLKHAFK